MLAWPGSVALVGCAPLDRLIEDRSRNRETRAKIGQVLSFRSYRSSDRAAVRLLHELALRHAGGFAEIPEAQVWDQDLEEIEGIYISTGGCFLIGESGGSIIAMGALRLLDGGRGEIKRMRVHPLHQRQGYGRALLTELEKAAMQRGVSKLVLDTGRQLRAANALYAAFGYHEVAREQRATLEMIFMEKTLGIGPYGTSEPMP